MDCFRLHGQVVQGKNGRTAQGAVDGARCSPAHLARRSQTATRDTSSVVGSSSYPGELPNEDNKMSHDVLMLIPTR